jgi:hypothetical protein
MELDFAEEDVDADRTQFHELLNESSLSNDLSIPLR